MAGIEYIRTEVPLRYVFNPDKTAPVFTFGSISFPEAQRLHHAGTKPLDNHNDDLNAIGTEAESSTLDTNAEHEDEHEPVEQYEDRVDVDPVKLLLDPGLREWRVPLAPEGVPDPDPHRGSVGSPRGLVNLGNTCYANVVMQTLQLCPWLRQVCAFVLGHCAAFADAPILRSFATFINLVNPNASIVALEGSGPARPDVFLRELEQFFSGQDCRPRLERNGRSGEIRVVGPQQDAQEFLGFVLDALQEEQVGLKRKWSTSSGKGGPEEGFRDSRDGDGDRDGDTDGWMEAGKGGKKAEVRDVGQSHETVVSALFQGTMRSIIRAGGSKSKQSVTMQPFYTLPLEVSSKNIKSLMDAIEQYMEPSYVDINLSRRQKILQFDRLPMVFVFHLKRFAYSRVTGMSSKVRKAIQYPRKLSLPTHFFTARYKMERKRETMEGCDIPVHKRQAEGERYQLFSVVLHKGTQIAVGHYTNYTYDFFHHAWFYFDDHVVDPVQECPMDHPDAYLLFYVNEKLITPSST